MYSRGFRRRLPRGDDWGAVQDVPMLRVEVQVMTQTATLRCSGRLVLGWETETLRYMTKSRPETCLILDLSGVHTVDAAGLGLLVELSCWAQQCNKGLTVINPSDWVSRLVALTNLHSVFEIANCPEAELDDAGDESELPFGRREMTA